MAKYGAQSWALNKDTAKRLATFERKILGRMLGRGGDANK